MLLVQQIGIGASEDLLPAQTIAHDENDVSSLQLRPAWVGREAEKQSQDNKKFTFQIPSIQKP